MAHDTTENNAAIIYSRVSTNRIADGTSLDSQRDACVAHASRLNYTVARAYEEVYSGAELFARPQLSLARADIQAGRYRALIVYSVAIARPETKRTSPSSLPSASGRSAV